MNIQTQMALEILGGYYGEPQWLKNPKEGQDTQQILETWDTELAPYSAQQVKEACAWLIRRRRVMTFPTINTLTVELVGKEPEHRETETKGTEAVRCYEHILQHANESNPPVSKLAAQRAIYNIYGVCMDGYDPNYKEEKWVNPTACRDELYAMERVG